VLTSDFQLFLAFVVEMAGADPKILSYILGGLFAMRVAHVYAPPDPSFHSLPYSSCFTSCLTQQPLVCKCKTDIVRNSELGLRGKDSNVAMALPDL
jgi:hypothetical protein